MALKHKQLLHRIATWVATSPELNSATDGLVMWAVWRKYQGQIEKRDLPFIVDRLIRTLREMVKLDALEAAIKWKANFPFAQAAADAKCEVSFVFPHQRLQTHSTTSKENANERV